MTRFINRLISRSQQPAVLTGALVVVMLMLAGTSMAATVNIQQTVQATDNLYYMDWGHFFTLPSDEALNAPGSQAALAVSQSGNYVNFAGMGPLTLVATGSVVDAGPYATGADGCPSAQDPCWLNDGNYFYETVYALIGLWSSTSDTITPIQTESEYGDWRDAVFTIGSSALLNVPAVEQAFLFLAENDGNFADNSGAYEVAISYSEVPLPAAGLFFLSALSLLQLLRARRP